MSRSTSLFKSLGDDFPFEKRPMDNVPPGTTTSTRPKRPRVAEENRKRAVRACDGCRRVKEKCEGGVPCRRCKRYRRQCVFNTIPESTERRPRLSIESLEQIGGLSRNDVAEAERVHYLEKIVKHYAPNLALDVNSLRDVSRTLSIKHQDSDSEAAGSQEELDNLGDLALDEDFTIQTGPNNTTQYSGEFSHLNFSMKIRRKIDEWMQHAAPEDPQEAVPFEERWRATQLESGSALVSASITCLPPRYVADFLVQIFFQYAQTNNFYVEESWLRGKLNICYTNSDILSPNDAAAVCAILMVLAIGTQFAHLDSPTATQKVSPDVSLSAEDQRFSEDDVGLTFYQFASKLLPDIIATASVQSVQACLLIGTYLLPLDTSGLSYTYFGLALKLAIQNGMHRKYVGEGIDPEKLEVRNRVFWTAYTIEKRVSILHGRPASLSDSDVDAELPVNLPGLTRAGHISNYTNMVALITLTLKLGEISDEISSLRRSRKGQQAVRLEKLLFLRNHLIDWWTTLPDQISCRDLRPGGGLFRSNVHLKLDYCLTRIFIGRPFLFSSVKAIGGQPGALPSIKSPTPSKTRASSIIMTDCVEAALEIVDLCRLLRDETGLARASYTEFSACRAALLVILAQSLTKRTERLKNSLAQGMGLIKIMSMGVGSARSAVIVIEALERAIRRLDNWSESQTKISPETLDSGYERFKSWEMLWKAGPISPESATVIPHLLPHTTSTPISQPLNGSLNAISFKSTQRDKTPPSPMSRDHKDIKPNIEAETLISDLGGDLFSASFSQVPSIENQFGMDRFVSNFPQELDEFTAIPYFDQDIAHVAGGDVPGSGGDADPRWMQFTMDS